MRHCQAPQSLDTFDPTCSPMLVSTMHLRVALALLRATPCVDEDFQHFSVLGWRASPHHYHYRWPLLLTVPLFGEQLLNFLSPANDKEPARVFIVHEAKAQDAHSSTQDLSQRAWALAKSPESARCLPQRCLCWSSSSTHVLIGFGLVGCYCCFCTCLAMLCPERPETAAQASSIRQEAFVPRHQRGLPWKYPIYSQPVNTRMLKEGIVWGKLQLLSCTVRLEVCINSGDNRVGPAGHEHVPGVRSCRGFADVLLLLWWYPEASELASLVWSLAPHLKTAESHDVISILSALNAVSYMLGKL